MICIESQFSWGFSTYFELDLWKTHEHFEANLNDFRRAVTQPKRFRVKHIGDAHRNNPGLDVPAVSPPLTINIKKQCSLINPLRSLLFHGDAGMKHDDDDDKYHPALS